MSIQDFGNLENIDSEVCVDNFTPAHVLALAHVLRAGCFRFLNLRNFLNWKKHKNLHKLKLLGNFHSIIFLIDRGKMSLNPSKKKFSKYFSFY